MTSTTKRGFHLPWSGDERKPDSAAAPSQASAAVAPAPRPFQRRERQEELGRGPFDLAPAVEPDVESVGVDGETGDSLVDFVDAAPPATPATPAPPAAPAATMAWPDVDRAGSPTHVASDRARPPARPALVVEAGDGAGARSARRDNPLVVGLVKVMRDSARATRQEAMTRMRTAAEERTSEIRAFGVSEAASLKTRADADVVGTREWSKAEIARVRDETEQRIAGRRAQLAREAQTQTAEIDRLIDEVKASTSAFEAEMDRFFEALLAEEDPARLATLAERLPEPPAFAKLVLKPAPADPKRKTAGRAAMHAQRRSTPGKQASARPRPSNPSVRDGQRARLAPEIAAAAEAEAIEGLDLGTQPADDWSTGSLAAVLATAPRIDSPDDLSPEERNGLLGFDAGVDADSEEAAGDSGEPARPAEVAEMAGPAVADEPRQAIEWEPIGETAALADPFAGLAVPEDQTRIVVTGLTSVAGISRFKAALTRVPGVSGVSVTSGEADDFVFSVVHAEVADLRRAVAGFAGFGAQMTLDEGAVVSFSVSEPTA